MSDLAEAGVDGGILMKRITNASQSLRTPRFPVITSVEQLCRQRGEAGVCPGGINVLKACAGEMGTQANVSKLLEGF